MSGVGEISLDAKWTPSSAEGRWCGFGPYYAMFPVSFVRETIAKYSQPGDIVLDPFCGRGTVSFVSQVTGRTSYGADTNSVAWLFAKVKTAPFPDPTRLKHRVSELIECISPELCQPQNEFQRWAWAQRTLGFLNVARSQLDWRNNQLDQTLMAIILVNLHGKLGEGLSNQLRQSKAMAPDYSVRWWKERELSPPEIDLSEFFEKKISWRYAKGIPNKKTEAFLHFGDSRDFLAESEFVTNLIVTSPPYCGLTNYSYDNWIRLWMLGGPQLPNYSSETKFANKEDYKTLIDEVVKACVKRSDQDVTIVWRTSAQAYSFEVAAEAFKEHLPKHTIAHRHDDVSNSATQTALYGNKWDKKGEQDFLITTGEVPTNEGYQIIG